jgi:putative FmdB family regulatory protein
MPVYEYKCEKGHVVEVIQSMADDPLTKCEECGAPAQRVLYAPAVHFKGKGFYNTDYGTKKRQREKAASKSKSSSDSSSSDSSSKAGSDSKSSSESKPKADSGSSAKPAKKD